MFKVYVHRKFITGSNLKFSGLMLKSILSKRERESERERERQRLRYIYREREKESTESMYSNRASVKQ